MASNPFLNSFPDKKIAILKNLVVYRSYLSPVRMLSVAKMLPSRVPTAHIFPQPELHHLAVLVSSDPRSGGAGGQSSFLGGGDWFVVEVLEVFGGARSTTSSLGDLPRLGVA